MQHEHTSHQQLPCVLDGKLYHTPRHLAVINGLIPAQRPDINHILNVVLETGERGEGKGREEELERE